MRMAMLQSAGDERLISFVAASHNAFGADKCEHDVHGSWPLNLKSKIARSVLVLSVIANAIVIALSCFALDVYSNA